MNQILSVEMPKNNTKTKRKREPGKASTKSVVLFFSIILIVFGIALILIGILTSKNNNNSNNNNPVVSTTQEDSKPRIDVSQNASEVEVEIFSQKQIAKIEYSWNNAEPEQQEVNGTNNVTFKLPVPSGSNTLTITATDADGVQNVLTKEGLIGEEEAKVALEIDEKTNTLKIVNDKDENGNVIEEEKTISTLEYHYDNEEVKTEKINGKKVEIEIPSKDGEHDLTVKLTFEDGTTKEKTQKVYFPEVKVSLSSNKEYFIIRIADKKTITKITATFNGQERTFNDINKTEFQGRLKLRQGENTLTLIVENSMKLSVKKTFKWDK